MKPLALSETWPELFAGAVQQREKSPNVKAKLFGDGQQSRSEDIATLPLFINLWHAIKPGCLDRRKTPCLPTNNPKALMSSPLFIIHNLLWCQGQSDGIVMVKGKLGDLRSFRGSQIQTNKNPTALTLNKNTKRREKESRRSESPAQTGTRGN